jgi:hypothetical protein
MNRLATLLFSACLCAPALAIADGPPDPQALIAKQREAMAPLKAFMGTWRGPAAIGRPDGSKLALVQTERVGPMLDGSIVLVEGRSYAADGSVAFNALGLISFDPATGKYDFRAHAQGHGDDFAIDVTPNGFAWTLPAGPGSIHYSASVKDDVWTETGDFVMPGQPARRIFEMTVTRQGDTDWPAANPVPAAP